MKISPGHGRSAGMRAVLLAALLFPLDALAGLPVEYELNCLAGGSGRVRLKITLPDAIDGPLSFIFPRAVPMGYSEHPFDRFVVNLRAFDDSGNPVPTTRGSGSRWTAGAAGSKIRGLEYQVDVARMEREILSAADTSKMREGYACFLGYTVFGFFEGLENRPVKLAVAAPAGWPVFCTLAPQAFSSGSSLQATAKDFYALADSQILTGPDLKVRRLRERPDLFLALYSEAETDGGLLGDIAVEAFNAMADYFGRIPFPHYTVCQAYLRPLSEKHEYGFSMEHLDSGTFFFAADQALSRSAGNEAILRARYNLAHHISHAWIPKRSFGEGYFPFSWERAPVIETIWFSEGFPQYAAIEALAATMSATAGEDYRSRMLETRFRHNLEEAPDFIRKLSLIELSRLASTRYSEDFRIGRNVFSRGGLMAAEMDDHIRRESGGKKRLRDALRHLTDWSERSARPFRIDELPQIFAEATGISTLGILERWLPAPGK